MKFSALSVLHPALSGTFDALDGLVVKHKFGISDLAHLQKQLPEVPPPTLAQALQVAVEAGVLEVRHTVLTPSGVIAPDTFVTVEEIPEKLADRFENYFETAEAEAITVFQLTQK